jgi:hypothetical protein
MNYGDDRQRFQIHDGHLLVPYLLPGFRGLPVVAPTKQSNGLFAVEVEKVVRHLANRKVSESTEPFRLPGLVTIVRLAMRGAAPGELHGSPDAWDHAVSTRQHWGAFQRNFRRAHDGRLRIFPLYIDACNVRR